VDDAEALVPTSMAIEGASAGLLSGLTFVAKDLFSIEGHTSSFGHATWRETHAPATTTSSAVAGLLASGADLVGLTKMDQLAYSLIGNVGEGRAPRNSTDPDLYCGGSSSGSAAAVAAGLSDFALGTDTAGSIRVPAAACGLASIRPTHGLIADDGVTPLAPSFDAVGLFARSASLLSRVLEVLTPAHSPDAEVRSIQFAADLLDDTDVETMLAGREIAAQLAEIAGVPLKNSKFGAFCSAEVGALFARLQSREIWATHSDWVLAHGADLADDVKTRLDRCELLSQDSPELIEADHQAYLTYRQELQERIPSGTVVVLPVVPEHGPRISWDDQALIDFRGACFRLSAPSSLSGAPQAVISVPSESSSRSIGIGLLTAPGDDRVLLDLLTSIETEAF
jgi:amidase